MAAGDILENIQVDGPEPQANGIELEYAWPGQAWGWADYITYNLDAQSGNTTKQVELDIPANARVRSVTGFLTGTPHDGLLRHFAGTSVSASAVTYDGPETVEMVPSGASTKAFVIDFGGIRKIKSLSVVDENLPRIELVLPWMGIEFGTTPLFELGDIHRPQQGYHAGFSEIETAKLLVQFKTEVDDPPGQDTDRIDHVLDNLSVISSTMPLNVKVAVGNQPVFHTFAGEFKGQHPLPEFADELNAYLDEIRAAGSGDVDSFPLMITMDAPGKVELGSFQLVYDREATALWGDTGRQSVSFDRQGVQELTLNFPAGGTTPWQIQTISFDVTHDFPLWRTFPRQIHDVENKIIANVSADLNLAQCLPMDETTQLCGMGIFIGATEEKSEILIEIQKDINGEPDDSPLLEQLISIEAGRAAGWLDIMFSKPLAVTAGRELWCVLKSKVGTLSLVLEKDGAQTPVRFNRNGAGFSLFPFNNGNVTLVFCLYRKPCSGETARAADFEIHGKILASDLPETANTLVFSFFDSQDQGSTGPVVAPSDNQVAVNLKITAHVSGSMTLSNVVTRYQHAP